jgi:hypothetical protein
MDEFGNMTPREREQYIRMMLGNDVDQGVLNDPMLMANPQPMIYQDPGTNSVYDPKTGAYLGQTQQMPAMAPGLLTMPQPAPMNTDPVVNNMFQRNNTTPVDMSQIDRLLQNLNRYR